MTMILSALPYGLLIGVLSMGVYISYKIMNIPDLTVDGSFAVGAVTNGILCLYGHPLLALFAGLFFGALAGMCTGLIHTQLKVNPILSGVLVQTALISVNVLIPLSFGEITSQSTSFAINQRFGGDTVFMMAQRLFAVKNPDTVKLLSIALLALIIVAVIALLQLFFSTQLGLSIRATGNNEEMVKASSINTNLNKVIAFTLANGIVGFGGALYVQYMRSYSEGIGLGMLVTALASIIIGETLFGNHRVFAGFFIVVLGSLIYRVIYAFAIRNGGANGIKLFSSVIVIFFIAFSILRKKLAEKRAFHKAQEEVHAEN